MDGMDKKATRVNLDHRACQGQRVETELPVNRGNQAFQEKMATQGPQGHRDQEDPAVFPEFLAYREPRDSEA